MINVKTSSDYPDGVMFPDDDVCCAAGITRSEMVPFPVNKASEIYLGMLSTRLTAELSELHRSQELKRGHTNPDELRDQTFGTNADQQLFERIKTVKILKSLVNIGVNDGIDWLILMTGNQNHELLFPNQSA